MDTNDDNLKIEPEFSEIILEFKRLNVAEVVNSGKGLRKNEFTVIFKDNGGFSAFYENEKINTIKKSERQDLKDEIDRLTLDQLNHKKKISEQEDRIRNLEEQLKTINVIKAYWWLIGLGVLIGGIFIRIIDSNK